MKKFLLLIIIGIVTFQFNISAQNISEKQVCQVKIAKFTNMKNIGVALTVGGAVLTVVGVGVMTDALSSEVENNYYDSSEDGKYMLGLLTASAGIEMAAGGIVLWCIGGSKKNKYENKLKSLSFNLNANPRQKLALVYKF